jgi:hypothetical protein
VVSVQVEASMGRIQQVYSIYEEHAKNLDSFATVLWADLDITKIMEATDEVFSKLKKMRHLQDAPVYDLVMKDISGFMSSLPLMKDLKSDALRKRHWISLMQVQLVAWNKTDSKHMLMVLIMLALIPAGKYSCLLTGCISFPMCVVDPT